jgi:broad specificity phosphatase PhoE
MRAAALLCCLLALASAAAGASSSDSRTVYLVRHGEAFKNIQSGKAADDPQFDKLTEQGRQQAAVAGARLRGVGLTAVVSAPEQRTRDTALAITSRALLFPAAVDPSLTSKAYDGESPDARATRGIAALRRFLSRTHGSVAVVSHGHLISLMTAKLTGQAFTPDVVKSELVNAGIIKLRVTGFGSSSEKWEKLEADGQVRDD